MSAVITTVRDIFTWLVNNRGDLDDNRDIDLAVEALRAADHTWSRNMPKRVDNVASVATDNDDKVTIRNLVGLVVRLALKLKKHEPDSKAAAQAFEFLDRKGLRGSVLRAVPVEVTRSGAAAAAAAVAVAEGCADWADDTGECYFCAYDLGNPRHGEDCPLPAYVRTRIKRKGR